jgi:eukaryotic-like serine/threonine-protein kinase
MLAGKPPFDGGSATEICHAHVRAPAPRARSPFGAVPAALAATVARCLAKDPMRRYPSMRALVSALEVAI